MKVISAKICPFVQRITSLLEAKNLAYEVEYIDLNSLPDWFLALSPNAQVPVLLTDSGVALFESDAIAEYIDEVTTPLEPAISAEQKALDRAWCYQATKHYLTQCGAMSSPDASSLASGASKMGKALANVERQLGAGPFFKGAVLSNIDIAWLPLIHRADIIEKRSGYDFLADFPKAKVWQSAVMATGLAGRSVSSDFEQIFSDFYLSNKTFLGAGENCESSEGCCGSSGGCG